MRSVIRNHRFSISSTIFLLALVAVASWGVSAVAGGSVSSSVPEFSASAPLAINSPVAASNGGLRCRFACYYNYKKDPKQVLWNIKTVVVATYHCNGLNEVDCRAETESICASLGTKEVGFCYQS